MEKGIVLFDGECNLCSKSVQFLLKNDHKDYFRFTSLQGNTGRSILDDYDIPKDLTSIVYIEDYCAYTQSDAVLMIARHLKGFWKYIAICRFIPVRLRDFLYRKIANNRHKIWGRSDSCLLPTEKNRSKFI